MNKIQSIEFDVNNRFVVLIGLKSLVIFNIELQKSTQYKLNSNLY